MSSSLLHRPICINCRVTALSHLSKQPCRFISARSAINKGLRATRDEGRAERGDRDSKRRAVDREQLKAKYGHRDREFSSAVRDASRAATGGRDSQRSFISRGEPRAKYGHRDGDLSSAPRDEGRAEKGFRIRKTSLAPHEEPGMTEARNEWRQQHGGEDRSETYPSRRSSSWKSEDAPRRRPSFSERVGKAERKSSAAQEGGRSKWSRLDGKETSHGKDNAPSGSASRIRILRDAILADAESASDKQSNLAGSQTMNRSSLASADVSNLPSDKPSEQDPERRLRHECWKASTLIKSFQETDAAETGMVVAKLRKALRRINTSVASGETSSVTMLERMRKHNAESNTFLEAKPKDESISAIYRQANGELGLFINGESIPLEQDDSTHAKKESAKKEYAKKESAKKESAKEKPAKEKPAKKMPPKHVEEEAERILKRLEEFDSDNYTAWPNEDDPSSKHEVRHDDEDPLDLHPRKRNARPIVDERPDKYERRNKPDDRQDKDEIPVSVPYTTAASEFLYGYNSVLAALRAQRRKIHKLYIHPKIFGREAAQGLFEPDKKNYKDKPASEFVSLARAAKIPFQNEFDTKLLDKMSDGRPHNGLVLEVSKIPAPPVERLHRVKLNDSSIPLTLHTQTKEEAAVNGRPSSIPIFTQNPNRSWRYPLVVFLDGITDPGNLGNILRTCHFYGVDAVAVAINTCCNLSSAVLAKASSGACESIPIIAVPKPADFIAQTSKNRWKIWAAVAPPTAPPKTTWKMYWHSSKVAKTSPLRKNPCVIMIGAEGAGLRENLKSKAGFFVSIGGLQREDGVDVGVDSLNVTVATGVLLESFLRQRSRDALPASEGEGEDEEEDAPEEDDDGTLGF